MADTFETYITTERDRIHAEREKLVSQQVDIDTKIAALDLELSAITAYEHVKSGRGAPATVSRTPRGTSTGGRRTGIRETVLGIVKQHVDGISAADVLKEADAESDSDKTSVRNALSALKRNGSVGLKNGKYVPA